MVIELSHTSRRVVEIAVKGSVFFPSAPTLLQLSFVSLSRYLLLFSHPSLFVYVCLYVFVCVSASRFSVHKHSGIASKQITTSSRFCGTELFKKEKKNKSNPLGPP